MFTETLSDNTKKALAVLSTSRLLDFAYLAGGTACALQLGHRISIDLDFFTQKEFDNKRIMQRLKEVGTFELDQEKWGTILGEFEKVKFSLFVYQYPLLFSPISFQQIQLADLRDIAAMKLDAISSRGIRRDFIDLYFICQHGITLSEIFSFYEKKYGTLASNETHLMKSLVYFEDAEASPEPHMLKPYEWNKVKYYFEQQLKKMF